jgi:SNF2 family DNA or RNA helicase/DNA-binding XRE family transcriptional regulator
MAQDLTIEYQVGDDYPTYIKRLRDRLGLTQKELAERLGVSFPTVNRWENGKAKPSQVCWVRIMELSGEVETPLKVSEPEPPPYGDTPPTLDFTAKPEVVRALVECERLSFGHLANPAFATEIASIDPLPHQRIAVYDYMLKQSRLRFLLADDAGAGKTIMTGLYIREMLSRRLLKRVLIIPPAGLVGNWQSELATLFSLKFNIVSGSDAKTGNPFEGPNSDRLIISVDTAVSDKVFARLSEEDVEPYDLVVFDEAHKLSCDRGNDLKIRKTGRYRLAEAIAGVQDIDQKDRLPWQAHHLLLLTATPHMGKDYPYFALWRLLEPDVLATFDVFEQFPMEKRQHYFIRRTKEEMVKFDGRPLYPKRLSDTLAFDLSQGEISEQKLYDDTTEYLRVVYNRAKLLNQSAARFAMAVFQRRLASSTYALLCSFERRIEKLTKIIDDVQRGKITFEQLLTLQRRLKEDDDVFDSKTADEESTEAGLEENENSEDYLLQGVIASSLADLVAEKEQVIELKNLAQRVYDTGHESKFEKLHEIITDKKFQNEKLIVFTEHRDTLDYLTRRLEGLGYTGQVAMIHGGMHYTERHEQVERFRKPSEKGGARFMICTDAAAEGINLQFCWIMVNYDIPWNPARLEQRMGRIHRYGQNHDPVVILNLVAPSTREGRVLKTLLDKLEKIRKQLHSEKVFDSIGRVLAGVSIKDYMARVLTGDVDTIAQELDGYFTKEQVKALADRERKVLGDGGDVKKDLPRLRDNMEKETYFRLLPGYIRKFIESASSLVNIEIEGDLGGYFSFSSDKKGAADPLLAALETYSPDQRSHLCIHRPDILNQRSPGAADDDTPCIWIHPGEPVFEAFRDIVRNRLGKEALQGAVFVDPTASKPYLFHLARLTVIRMADPELKELGQEETIECRLLGVCQSEGTDIRLCPVEHLLLLKGGYGLPPEAQRMAVLGEKHKAQVSAYLAERVSRSMAVEHRSKMVDSLPEREEFVIRGFNFKEAELATARSSLSKKARQGNNAAAQHLSYIKTQQKSMADQRDKALAIIRREPELIVPGDVDFIAHALVVPSTDQADIEHHQANVEQIAMELTRAFEEAAGARVEFVHTPELARKAGLPDHPGFDVFARRKGGARRCIEVKGRAGVGEIQITDNEWARACNLRQDYWLYVVYHCATSTPQIVRVQDPFDKLLVRPFKKTQVVETVREVGGVKISHNQVMEVGEI